MEVLDPCAELGDQGGVLPAQEGPGTRASQWAASDTAGARLASSCALFAGFLDLPGEV